MATGLYVNYRQSEQCFAAIQLAELLASFGQQVVIYSPQSPHAIGSTWDRGVLSPKKLPFKTVAKAFDWWIWFEHDPKMLELSYDEIRNTLIPSWHKLSGKHEDTINLYSEVVAPAEAVKRALDQKEFALPVYCTPWDAPGNIQEVRTKPRSYYCRMHEKFAAYDVARLAIVDFLLSEGYPVTLVKPTTSLPDNVLEVINEWASIYRNLLLLPASTVLDHRSRMAQCQWSVILDSADNFGYACLESLSQGLPVICYDVPPREEYLKQMNNCVLMDCNLEMSYLGAPRAIVVNNPEAKSLSESLWPATREKLKNVTVAGLTDFKEIPHVLTARREGFRAHWERLARST